jgi:hypothetical protein
MSDAIGPPFISGLDAYWIDCDERHDPHPVAMLMCRRCAVHHVLWPDADDNPPTLAAVVELAREHEACHADE